MFIWNHITYCVGIKIVFLLGAVSNPRPDVDGKHSSYDVTSIVVVLDQLDVRSAESP